MSSRSDPPDGDGTPSGDADAAGSARDGRFSGPTGSAGRPAPRTSRAPRWDPPGPPPPAADDLPPGVILLREVPVDGPVPHARHPGWEERLPWLVQGTTTRGETSDPLDLALVGVGDPDAARARWRALALAVGLERAVHARQVHGVSVRFHEEGPPGLQLMEGIDGHATRTAGILLGVTVADCVPVFVVDEERRAVAVLHAGWRGAASGILEAGIRLLVDRVGSRPGRLDVHLGPAICGACYEVGPEVHEALGLPVPETARTVDLRAHLARRAVGSGVPASAVSVSAWCTRCGDSPFFSHRGLDAARQVGFVGILR